MTASSPQVPIFNIPTPDLGNPFRLEFEGDARDIRNIKPRSPKLSKRHCLPDKLVDVIVTSPPYWNKRDYGVKGQIGQEETPSDYVEQIMECMRSWKNVLRPTGSIFLNVGDTYYKKSLQGIPSRIECAAIEAGWKLRNKIAWVKKGGMPDPAKDRLASRYESIFHFTLNDDYYYDLFGYSEKYSQNGRGANPGDVWELDVELELGDHLAPFPTEIARRAIILACPKEVCRQSGMPRRRIIEKTHELDIERPQARRAMELASLHGLTPAHFAAIRATGISDAGKARHVQSGTDRNTPEVKRLAAEAKTALGGYFREYTFAKKRSAGWTKCPCCEETSPGIVLDPFMGTGTTLSVAVELGRSAIGIDLA